MGNTVKIKKKFNQRNKWEFRPKNILPHKPRKGGANSQNKGQSKEIQPHDNQPKSQIMKGNGKSKKDIGKW